MYHQTTLSTSSSIASQDEYLDYLEEQQMNAPPIPEFIGGSSPSQEKDDKAGEQEQEQEQGEAETSNEKGKGKQKEKEKEKEKKGDSSEGERVEHGIKVKVDALKTVDNSLVKDLIDRDPTPINQLSPSTKILRAMHILSQYFQVDSALFEPQQEREQHIPAYLNQTLGGLFSPFGGNNPYYGPGSTFSFPPRPASGLGGVGPATADTPTTLPPYPRGHEGRIADFSNIMELLNSTLQDVAMDPVRPMINPDFIYEQMLTQLQGTMAAAGLGSYIPSFLPPTLPRPSAFDSAPLPSLRPEQKPPAPPSFPSAEDTTITSLLSHNYRLLLLKLQPTLITPPAPATASTSSDPSNPLSTSSLSTTDPSGKPAVAYIHKLPSELLTIIFRLARAACEERLVNPDGSPVVLDEHGNPRQPPNPMIMSAGGGRNPYGQPQNGPIRITLMGSRTNAQKWCHQLSLVCKDWKSLGRSVALAKLHLRRTSQLPNLLKFFAEGDNATLASQVLSVNIKIPTPIVDPDLVSGQFSGRPGSNWRMYQHLGAYPGSFGLNGSNPGTPGGSKSGDKEEENHGAMFGKLVNMAENLQNLSFTVMGSPYSQSYGHRATHEFLEPQTLRTLSHIRLLSTLNLGTTIDFDELEVILLGVPHLKHLHLEAGFDDFNSSGTVSSTVPHQCRFKTLIIAGTLGGHRDFTQITEAQLSWLVEPAVATLKDFEISVLGLSQNNGPMFGANQPMAPCFASAGFADLLARMRRLERLSLKDVSNGGATVASFSNPPHNSNFDFALSSLTTLKELTIQFSYTSANFLASLRSSSKLETLYLSGVPAPTTVSLLDIATSIELGDELKGVKKLVLFGNSGTMGRGTGFKGPDVRRVKEVCKLKEVTCVFVQN